jgi:hypothetical protein
VNITIVGPSAVSGFLAVNSDPVVLMSKLLLHPCYCRVLLLIIGPTVIGVHALTLVHALGAQLADADL